MKPVPEFKLTSSMLLRVIRALYGIAEAGLHWFRTYIVFHRKLLDLTPSAHDLCFLFTRSGPAEDSAMKPAVVTCLHTDDSLFLANANFQKLEENTSRKFQRKPLLRLAMGSPLKINGTIATRSASGISVTSSCFRP